MKVAQDRAELKDYNDIVVMLEHGVDLSMAVGAARAIYGDQFNPLLNLKALSFFQDGDLPMLSSVARTRLMAAVKNANIAAIPTIALLEKYVVPEHQK
ncbi:MAG: hypothetical protein ACYC9L_02665 [Sulfuricaulis sp.]